MTSKGLQVAITVLRWTIGTLVGIPIGAVAGFLATYYGGWLVFGQDWLQVGWVFLFITLPMSMVAGGWLGGTLLGTRPALFALTFLPLAILFGGFAAIYSSLSDTDRPRHFVLIVDGTHGAEFVGTVTADGERHRFHGSIPARCEFNAFLIESQFALVNPEWNHRVHIRVYADGHHVDSGFSVPTGIFQRIRSYGYSQAFGGTNSSSTRMNPEDVQRLLAEFGINVEAEEDFE